MSYHPGNGFAALSEEQIICSQCEGMGWGREAEDTHWEWWGVGRGTAVEDTCCIYEKISKGQIDFDKSSLFFK